MHPTHRVRTLERRATPLPDGRRRCPACRDGAGFRSVTRLDGVPAFGATEADLACCRCGRENPYVADVREVNADSL